MLVPKTGNTAATPHSGFGSVTMGMGKLGRIDPRLHKLLWIILLGLTTILLLWRVTPSPTDPLPVQSIYTIQYFPLFIAVFFTWAVILAVILFLARGNTLESLVSCLVFTVVFIGFWGFITAPWGNSGDSAWLMGHVNYLIQTGRIPTSGYLGLSYFDYPGFSLIAVTMFRISGANLFLTAQIYVLLSVILYALLLYVGFLTLLKIPYLAALTVVLAVASSMILAVMPNQFHPTNLATVYIITFILIVMKYEAEGLSERKVAIILLLLLIAAAVEYMFTPVFFTMVLLAFYLIHHIAKAPKNIALTTVILPLVLFMAWQVYWTVWNFHAAVSELPVSVQAILNGQWFTPVERVFSANIGARYPWWGNIARLFWWTTVFGCGTLLMLWRLLHWREADRNRRLELSLFVGTLVTVFIGSFVGGAIGVLHGGISRYVWIAPLILAAPIVKFLSRPDRRVLTVAFTIVGILLIVPTFLTNASIISVNRVYQHEITSFEFMSSTYGTGAEMLLYGIPAVSDVRSIYLLDARLKSSTYLYGGVSEDAAWKDLQYKGDTFLTSSHIGNIAIVSTKARQIYQLRLNVSLDDPNWHILDLQLSAASRVYDNGNMQLYVPS